MRWGGGARLCLLVAVLAATGCSQHAARAPVSGRSPGSSSHPLYHVVRSGDTLYSIAFQHGLRYQTVARWNGIEPPYLIYPRQRIRLAPPPPSRHPAPRARAGSTGRASAPPHPAPRAPAKPAPATPAPAYTDARARPVREATPTPSSAGRSRSVNGHAVRLSGGIRWQWPARGPLLRPFDPKSVGKKGLGIGGHRSQPVYAAAAGRVVYAGSGLIGYGKLIILKHNKNYLSAYAHCRAIHAKEGDRVARGEHIADMGSTGTSTVMLHFEIRRDGQPVDPLRYLPPPDP
jgi:lipoprotein NlpD